jgi:hypothetical protein
VISASACGFPASWLFPFDFAFWALKLSQFSGEMLAGRGRSVMARPPFNKTYVEAGIPGVAAFERPAMKV